MINEEQEKILNKYGIDKNNIIETDNIINPFIYKDMNGFLLINLFEINETYFNICNIKELIDKRKEYINKCIDEKDFNSIFYLIEKPYRMQVFIENFYIIPNKYKYNIFLEIYISSEYGFKELIESGFIDIILKYKPEKEYNGLPEELIIYRGEGKLSTEKEKALSWTLKKEVAEFFANRFNSNGKIYKGKVKKENIIDYLKERGEEEILVKYENIYDIEEIK